MDTIPPDHNLSTSTDTTTDRDIKLRDIKRRLAAKAAARKTKHDNPQQKATNQDRKKRKQYKSREFIDSDDSSDNEVHEIKTMITTPVYFSKKKR